MGYSYWRLMRVSRRERGIRGTSNESMEFWWSWHLANDWVVRWDENS
jgi:hypothetical protein